MEPQAPYKEFPRFGRDSLDHAHAPYAIVMLLQQIGLSAWTAVLLGWLGRYDGLEEHLHQEEDPACCIRDVLMRHAIQVGPIDAAGAPTPAALRERKRKIVLDLLQLDFIRCKAYWGPFLVRTMVWSPLEQSWMGFLDRVPHHDDAEYDEDKSMHVWLGEKADPDFQQNVHDLLMGIASEHQRDRHDDDQSKP